MYRSEVHQALTRVDLIPGGAIASLLDAIRKAEIGLGSSIEDIASGNDARLRSGVAKLHEAIKPIGQRLSEVSPSATAVELHQLGSKFDSVLSDFHEISALLYPGKQALSALAGAFDVVMQQNRRPSAVIGLIRPGVTMAMCYAHYDALKGAFYKYSDSLDAQASIVTLEISEAHDLSDFSEFVALIAALAQAALVSFRNVGGELLRAEQGISIANIESGSPIKISLLGDGKTTQVFLAMLRDVVRVPYQYMTVHGRTIQAMETLARAKELGIDTPEALQHLSSAVADASATYARSISRERGSVSINGEPIKDRQLVQPSLSLLDVTAEGGSIPQLASPSTSEDL